MVKKRSRNVTANNWEEEEKGQCSGEQRQKQQTESGRRRGQYKQKHSGEQQKEEQTLHGKRA